MNNPQIDDWLGAFPREQVESKVRELEAELARWRSALEMHNALAGTPNGSESDDGKPNKPTAILKILSEADKPMKPAEIRDEMVRRGWLEDSPKVFRRFYSTMSRMKGEERIKRVSGGKYVLPTEGRLLPE